MAGVTRLVFYTVDGKGTTDLENAVARINSLGESILDTKALLMSIRDMGFKWGLGDGN
jgi:hypothetical protein